MLTEYTPLFCQTYTSFFNFPTVCHPVEFRQNQVKRTLTETLSPNSVAVRKYDFQFLNGGSCNDSLKSGNQHCKLEEKSCFVLKQGQWFAFLPCSWSPFLPAWRLVMEWGALLWSNPDTSRGWGTANEAIVTLMPSWSSTHLKLSSSGWKAFYWMAWLLPFLRTVSHNFPSTSLFISPYFPPADWK